MTAAMTSGAGHEAGRCMPTGGPSLHQQHLNISIAKRSKLVNKADSREELRVSSDTFLDTGHAYEDHSEAALIEDGA